MLKDFKPILKNRNFVYLWTSQITSQLTINIMNFVFLMRLFEKTGSAIAVSLLWVAYSLPAILIGPIASSSVDIFNRKKILVITNLLQSLTVLFYAFFHGSNIFLIYEVVFVYSLLNQFYVPAESASLPSFLHKKKLTQANSLFFLTLQGAIVVGFGIAGLLNHLLGFEGTLFLCSFLVFTAFVCTTFLPSLPVSTVVPRSLESALATFFSRIIEGYKFIKSNRRVMAPFFMLICLQVAVQVTMVQVPILAKNLLRIPLNTAGVYLLVPAAIGAILGAVILPKLIASGWRKKEIIEKSLILISVLLIVLTFILPLFGFEIRVIASILIILLLGFSFISVIVPSQTYLQEWTPRELRGRVFGNFWFLVTIASVFPVLFSGTIVEILGIKFFLLILAGLSFFIFTFSKKYGDRFLQG